nr:MAG TPA: Portal protein [Caudoviricetes sp.]
MNLFKRFKRMGRAITESEDLKAWKARFDNAKNQYSDARNKIKRRESYYDGTRQVQANPNTGRQPTKQVVNRRNIVYELLESEVDSSIPMPRVRAIHASDDDKARKIERLLENKIKTCRLYEINDLMERVVPTQGGDFFFVQWDENAGRHAERGDLSVAEVHPYKLIPQPGVKEITDMDYFFIQEAMTRAKVKQIYGVDVSDAENDETMQDQASAEDIVTVNTAFYKTEIGIGCFIWCDFYELLNMADYQARYLDHCAKCGAVMRHGICPECGGKKKDVRKEEYEEILEGFEVELDKGGKKRISPFTMIPEVDDDGKPVLDDFGSPRVKKIRKQVPYYKPNIYPVILRRNITHPNTLLGTSDVDVIVDQQDTVNKGCTKVNEKLFNGGSFVTLPRGTPVELTEEELKVIRVDNPNEKSLIDVLNVQPNVSYDLSYIETNYNWAKSTLGITDSYQGKYDASATSGTAKQYAINQAAGRLESKRTMKNQAYAKLYEMMFKYWLAYADQDTPIQYSNSAGEHEYDILNRHEFLKLDAGGELYWDDEFIFDTDPTSTLMQNREAMWQQADLKLQSGAFGPVGDLETAQNYWTLQKANGYPNAGMILDMIEMRRKKQEEMQNAMSQVQNGNEDTRQYSGETEGQDIGLPDPSGMQV